MSIRFVPLLVMLSGCGQGFTGLAFPPDFLWGAATSAHQIEGGNTNNNWYQFETLPEFAGKTAAPSGQAANGWNLFEQDADLGAALGLDVYRFSVEWSRIEPSLGTWDEDALAHYDRVIDATVQRGMQPMITLHHFTDPIWVLDLRQLDACLGENPPIGDQNLCGWQNPRVAEEWVKFVEKVAARYGDRVDWWVTINEPMVPPIVGWVYGAFPPGKFGSSWQELVLPVIRNMLRAHAEAYRAIHERDTIDADGDGVAARVGFSQSVAWYVPADEGSPSDIEAAALGEYFMNYFWVEALEQGGLDADLDGVMDEQHPEWKGTRDFLGLQYYYRAPTVRLELYPPITFAPCLLAMEDIMPGLYESIGCPEPDENALTLMGYEHNPEGLYRVAKKFAARYPGLPLIVTENGISTHSGRRRIQSLVRHLEWLHRAITEGVDLRGYIYWSLMDNFEWAEGFEQPFGLYRVNFDTFLRTPTEAVEIYRRIISDGGLAEDLSGEFGGSGPLAPEP